MSMEILNSPGHEKTYTHASGFNIIHVTLKWELRVIKPE